MEEGEEESNESDEVLDVQDLEVLWFPCPSCDRVVTGVVLNYGPKNAEVSRTHCCFRCERGEGHDDCWCSGTPGSALHEVELPHLDSRGQALRAHYLLHQPDWDVVVAPVPALLFLHGALTYIWPETLHMDVQKLVAGNAVAKDFVIVAPLATPGEPLAVLSESQTHLDRFDHEVVYVDRFDEELTWQCFLAACGALGAEHVDFTRLCATGYSMGAQATWDFAIHHGSQLAAIAPLAGCCKWPDDAWMQVDAHFEEMCELHVRAFSIESDTSSYELGDFEWLATRRGLASEPCREVRAVGDQESLGTKVEIISLSWGELANLYLIRNDGDDSHNCWDWVYQAENVFGLFGWMASCCNLRGASLAEYLGVAPVEEDIDRVQR